MIDANEVQKSTTVRLFIAVDLPSEVTEEVARIQDYFKKKDLFKGKYTDAETVHITLKFLGDVALEKLPEIDAALRTITFRPLPAHLGSLDLFFTHNTIKILYLMVVCPELTQLVKRIDTTLLQWFEPESRPFVSHATLARVKEVANKARLCNEANRFMVAPLAFTIDRFVLKQSVLAADGPTYTEIETYLL